MTVTATTRAKLKELQDAHLLRALKYASVSIIGVVVTQILLLITYQGLDFSAAWANFVSVSIASLPAYLLNRRWVWQKSGAHSVHREVLPFWGFSLLGLLISTVAVGWVSQHYDSQLAVSFTNIASFGLLWVAKYFVLDGWMFGKGEHSAAEDLIAEELAQIGHEDESAASAPAASRPADGSAPQGG
jgi:putative flippase GtrA